MSVLNRSDYLELSVIKIFEDYYDSGGNFFLISPWINNFNFTETIMTKNQTNIFGSNPNLYEIIKKISEKQSTVTLKIINHNYGIKCGLSSETVLIKIQDVEKNIKNHKEDESQRNIRQLYYSLTDLSWNYKDYSKFNDPWIYRLPRRFDDYLQSLSSKEKYVDAIGKIISSINQVKSNLTYLQSFQKIIKIKNLNLYFHKNFHAKIFVAGTSCVTGSSNWTYSGFHNNDEINLFFSSHTSKEGFEKIVERCYELKKESDLVLLSDLENNIAINTLIGEVYERFFDWLTDNKTIIINAQSN